MQTNNSAARNNIRVFGTVAVMTASAILATLSIILGKFLSIPVGNSIRIGFENLPIVIASIFFGPVIGATTAVVADIVGCILHCYAINPIITLGALCIGLISGLVYGQIAKNDAEYISTDRGMHWVKIFISVISAYAVGSMVIKSLGLYIAYGTPLQTIVFRVITASISAVVDTTIIWGLIQNKGLMRTLGRITKR
ncbi:folate family ECF transporter S component [Ruminococcus albus]|uniref:ECF transporter S component, folate family n=1 Tax=Ruminococcus albus TaxID=1264 RepID=A0A1H7J3Z5_RUMAL|nr:folate family ECF transporter S component [Ruminococcus albus]SEK68617.1 ECF transporter S component, folate family [Ruminococcus albus]